MDLREAVAKIVHEEMGDCIRDIRFTGPYEGEEFNIVIGLQSEPKDIDGREASLRRRVRALGYDIGITVDYPEELVAA